MLHQYDFWIKVYKLSLAWWQPCFFLPIHTFSHYLFMVCIWKKSPREETNIILIIIFLPKKRKLFGSSDPIIPINSEQKSSLTRLINKVKFLKKLIAGPYLNIWEVETYLLLLHPAHLPTFVQNWGMNQKPSSCQPNPLQTELPSPQILAF